MGFLDRLGRRVGDVRGHERVVQVGEIRLGKIEGGEIGVEVREVAQHQVEQVALHGVVDPGIGGIQVRRVGGNGPVILPDHRAFCRVDESEGGVFLVGGIGLARPDDAQVHVTRDQGKLGAVAVEQLDAGDEFRQFSLGLLELGGVFGVDIVAQRQQGHADDDARVVQQDEAPRVFRIPQIGIGFRRGAHGVGVVDDGIQSAFIGNGVLVAGIEGLVHVIGIQVVQDGQFAFVQFLEHPVADHQADDIVGRLDQVVGRAARRKFGVHVLVGGVFIVVDLDPIHQLEALLPFGGNVLGPDVEVQFLGCDLHLVFRRRAGKAGRGNVARLSATGRQQHTCHGQYCKNFEHFVSHVFLL